MKKNKRKIQVLAILTYSNKGKTASEILELCEPRCTLGSLMTSLNKYRKYNLIKKQKQDNKFVYSITKKGEKRLNWLISNFS